MSQFLDRNPQCPVGSGDSDTLEYVSGMAEVVHKRYGKLIHYILTIFGLPEEIHQDLFNQVFVKIMGGLRRMKHRENIKSWVTTITRNEVRSFLRRRSREARMQRSGNGQVIFFEFAGEGGLPLLTAEAEVFGRQLQSAFRECVAQLPRKIREPFLLRFRDLRKWEEVASALGITIDKARRWAEKARSIVVRAMQLKLGKKRRVQGS